MSDLGRPGVVHDEKRECPYPDCDWRDYYDPGDETDIIASEEMAERHFERVHKGEARLRVVLDVERSLHPDQELTDLLDRLHDQMAGVDDLPYGLEVAYVFGEILEDADELPEENRL